MKRPRLSRDTLTGGTGDVKPQILTITTGVAAAIDDYVTAQSTLPIPRFGSMKTKATIFEFLWVDWYLNLENTNDVTAHLDGAFLSTVVTRDDGDTVTVGSQANDAADPRNFAMAVSNFRGSATGAAYGIFPIHIDLTDGAGNGMLVATDRIVITGFNQTGASAGQYIAKIGYRLTNVGITEYVGIVQAQQQ